MRLRIKRLLVMVLVLLGVPLATSAPVSACQPPTPTADGAFKPLDRVETAETVLVGKVVGVDNPAMSYEAKYTVQVLSYLKQTGPDVVLVTGHIYCWTELNLDGTYIFYLLGNPAQDAPLEALYVHYLGATDAVTSENIAEISAKTGQEPSTTSYTPLDMQLRYSPVFRLLVLLGTPALILSIVLALGTVYQRNKKSKRKNDES